jgi:hypothetical protein
MPTTSGVPVRRKARQWKLSYRFYPHFHPYLVELVTRLNEGSVIGLQAADTRYVENHDDGTLETLPASTRVMLASAAKVTVDGATVTLSGNTPVILDDDIKVTVDGDTVTLPGRIPKTSFRDTQVTLPNDASKILILPEGTPVILSKGTRLTLPAGTPVILSKDTHKILSDATSAICQDNIQGNLLGGKPRPELYESIFSEKRYKPNNELVRQPYPVKDLDFSSSGAYAVYNWELFFHVPLTIAVHLSKNQRFEESQRWFHYIFDPTDDSEGSTPERFWKVQPFQHTDVELVGDILVNLATGADLVLKEETITSINKWADNPFRPHLVASYRQSAYMFKTVMAYLDNLIAWGDTLFREDKRESINEATQLYILAANILGPRPQAVPKKGSVRPQTYANLKEDLDKFSNAIKEQELNIPFDIAPNPNDVAAIDRYNTLRSLGQALYFCVPRNDKLLSYWDTVADRLFKIRNSLNIQGIVRQLPLFAPPIDPALLARAAAAGLDVGAVISGANQPLPLVRFQFLVQKAAELCNDVKTLGAALLATIEKKDAEELALIRAGHETALLKQVEKVRLDQLDEAKKAAEGLTCAQKVTEARLNHYRGLPDRIPEEESQLSRLAVAQSFQSLSLQAEKDAANWSKIPDFSVTYGFNFSAPPSTGVSFGTTLGGRNVAGFFQGWARHWAWFASDITYGANLAGIRGAWARRREEWDLQISVANAELEQIKNQIDAANIRVAIAQQELDNHRQQMKQAEEIEYFLSGEVSDDGKPDSNWKKKNTNHAFYTWMKREVKGLYGQCFQFAFDIARKAERALQHELGNSDLSYLQFDYLAGNEGLLAGEKLYLDIKRMEMAYHDLNQRGYELTKHVSLLQVDPLALLQLRATGRCIVSLPEELFDMDGPGHYFRRIKSVAVSIPCVVGPYTSVNCTLTLLKSRIRKIPQASGDDYAYTGAEDPRFDEHFGSLQSVVTSSAQNDSGMFETNLRDERYLPFEGSGVISEWQVELPAEVRQFDYDTISDMILHIRYTAREGGKALRDAAVRNLTQRIAEAQAAGSVRLFSVRHEFPTAWAKFKSVKTELTLEIREEHFPFWSKGRLDAVKLVVLFTRNIEIVALGDDSGMEIVALGDDSGAKITTHKSDGTSDTGPNLDNLTNIPLPKPPDTFTLKLNLKIPENNKVPPKKMADLWLALAWGKAFES